MSSWQLQEAKARFSELVRISKQGPQEITVHGQPVAVLVSKSDYERLRAQHQSLVAFMQASPLSELSATQADRVFKRDRSKTREIKL